MSQLTKFIAITLLALFIFSAIFCQVIRVGAIGITVKEMDRSVKFYTEVLGFKKISEAHFQGEAYEKLEGLFGLNSRVS